MATLRFNDFEGNTTGDLEIVPGFDIQNIDGTITLFQGTPVPEALFISSIVEVNYLDINNQLASISIFNEGRFPPEAPPQDKNGMVIAARIPEPTTLALMAVGFVGLGFMRRRRPLASRIIV